jgi:hypothetical protein
MTNHGQVKGDGYSQVGLAPVACLRANCHGTIPCKTLAYQLSKGGRPVCRVCQALKQTRYYKMPPGAERSFNFKVKGPVNPPRPKGKPNAQNDQQFKQQQQRIAELERKLEKSIKEKEQSASGGGGEGGEAADTPGFNSEDAARVKSLTKQRSMLLAMSEAEKEAAFSTEEVFQARLVNIAKERADITARNRARLPIKEQHLKQSSFVKKLAEEIEGVKKEQSELIMQWQGLENKVEAKTVFLREKQAELADLAKKVAEEDAIIPSQPAAPAQAAQVHTMLDENEAKQFELLRAFMAKSNIIDLFKAEGAKEHHVDIMEQMWDKVHKSLQPTNKPASPPAAQAPASSNAGNSGPVAQPVPGDGEDMELDEFDATWQNHIDSNASFASFTGKELASKKATFIAFLQSSKRLKMGAV